MKNRRILLLSAIHLAMDMNQGAIPALIPYLIVSQGLSFTAAAGIVFAANISSSVVQPLFGYYSDRLARRWLIPSGLLLGGGALAASGVVPGYGLIFFVVALSGLGVAAFHPEAARLANLTAGENKGMAMSLFATGGYLGYALGPLFITAALTEWSMKGTLLLIVPSALAAAAFILKRHGYAVPPPAPRQQGAAGSSDKPRDAWGPFGLLSLAVVSRSVIFFGLNTFLPLYWINVLGQSRASSGRTLTLFFASGVIGTLFGGRLADRLGYRRVVILFLACLTVILPFFMLVRHPLSATLLLIPIGFVLFASYSPMVVIGQKLLPNHIGFASGVTLGLAVTVGGVAAPLFGKIADTHGIAAAVSTITFLPILPLCFASILPKKVSQQGGAPL